MSTRHRRRRTPTVAVSFPDSEKRFALNRLTWAATELRRATASRDEAIARAKESGASIREIAEACGVHRTTVTTVLRQQGEDAAVQN